MEGLQHLCLGAIIGLVVVCTLLFYISNDILCIYYIALWHYVDFWRQRYFARNLKGPGNKYLNTCNYTHCLQTIDKALFC